MSQPEGSRDRIYSAAVSDRGLSEKRPINEDSYLSDPERTIFAVADGVGGAEAGEVASRTAIEVLDEAFRYQNDGADIEDLMELAIQRANASIHRMAHEHARFSMMATTIVALHLRGNVATIGHVGDSRLYRLTPDGGLVRETEDHSIVEEEVRAGRMTPEQAAHHPSKNVISRALGAEEGVEVDMKTIEVESGTSFILCSDGITRHISDSEIRALLLQHNDLESVCQEFKARCYERGADDNLTAVVVRVGEPSPASREAQEGQRTLSLEHPSPAQASQADAGVFTGNYDLTEDALAQSLPKSQPVVVIPNRSSDSRGTQATGSSSSRFLIFLLFVVAVAGAFYGGHRYRGTLPFGLDRNDSSSPAASPAATPDAAGSGFETARRDVDRDPAAWLVNDLPKELQQQHVATALDSRQPTFLYLYGRALLLTGKNEEAGRALEQAIVRADQAPSAENTSVRRDASLCLAAIALKSGKEGPKALAHYDEMMPKPAATVNGK